MRIHRLEIEGFGPFRDRQLIDFDAFADDGIFLISGRTGAGKSSILDAVCFALYGAVPRYEDGDKRLRSDHSEPGDATLVTLEFSSHGDRWRIERAPEYARPKRRGTGTTNQPAEARMAKWVAATDGGGGWQGQAARPVDVAMLLDEIIGLNQQQFLQVILLAQNRFARFLLAKNDERQSLLRTLFGTRTFDAYEKALDARRKEAESSLAAKNQALVAYLEQAESVASAPSDDSVDLASRLAQVTHHSLRARHEVETAAAVEAAASTAREAAEATHATRVHERENQQRRDASREALAALDARQADVNALREERDAALRAEVLRAPIDAAHRAAAAVTEADAVEAKRVTAWKESGGFEAAVGEAAVGNSAVGDADDLDRFVAALGREMGHWSAALSAEQALPQAEAEHERCAELLRSIDALIVQNDAQRHELPERRDRLDAEITEAARAAALEPAAETLVDELAARRIAAAEAVELGAVAAAADEELLRCGKALTAASAHLDALRERRLAGFAAELAEALEHGEPCAVCGATTHPAPAPHRDDPVTPEAIAAADDEKTAAWKADQAAAEHQRSAQQNAAAVLARTGGLDVKSVDTALEKARLELSRAQEAAARGAALTAERETVASALARADAVHEARASERVEIIAQMATSAQILDAARSAARAACGPFATVAQRIADAENRLAAGRDLAEALRTASRARQAAAAAAADLARALSQGSFESEAAATSALRDEHLRAQLDDAVREYDATRAGERSRLLQLEMQVLPEEPIDTAVTQAAATAAAQAWSDAVAARASRQQRAETLADATARAEVAHAAIAQLAAQAAVVERLANTVAGRAPNTKRMKLETFVLAAELEEIVSAANVRLGDMSDGRYRLQHTDALLARGAASGLGLEVMDQYTGQARPPQSLSGGETFLASLALALGLAEVVTSRAGGITLDTLFIDEGFGALDPETLEVAMRTLDELRQGGRTVGIISHVEAMKEQIPAQLVVEVTPSGWSAVRPLGST